MGRTPDPTSKWLILNILLLFTNFFFGSDFAFCFIYLLWDRVSCSSNQPWTLDVANDNFELWILCLYLQSDPLMAQVCNLSTEEEGKFEVSLVYSARSSLKNKAQQQKVAWSWMWWCILITQLTFRKLRQRGPLSQRAGYQLVQDTETLLSKKIPKMSKCK